MNFEKFRGIYFRELGANSRKSFLVNFFSLKVVSSFFPVEFLVTQLTELVRMAFIAGTSTNDLLKLEGMKTLQVCMKVYN